MEYVISPGAKRTRTEYLVFVCVVALVTLHGTLKANMMDACLIYVVIDQNN
jgi:hypothetical protein